MRFDSPLSNTSLKIEDTYINSFTNQNIAHNSNIINTANETQMTNKINNNKKQISNSETNINKINVDRIEKQNKVNQFIIYLQKQNTKPDIISIKDVEMPFAFPQNVQNISQKNNYATNTDQVNLYIYNRFQLEILRWLNIDTNKS